MTAGEATATDVRHADVAATGVPAALVAAGRALHAAGLSPGASGNLSVKDADGIWATPTGTPLGGLSADALSRLDHHGRHRDGPAPTKEVPLHLALYARLPAVRAVVHLHSSHAVAVSCLDPLPPQHAGDAVPALTPYFVMRVGRVPLLPYAAPGTAALAEPVADLPPDTRAALLANHGPVTTGTGLDEAVAAALELEETARLHLLLAGLPARTLTPAQQAELTAPR